MRTPFPTLPLRFLRRFGLVAAVLAVVALIALALTATASADDDTGEDEGPMSASTFSGMKMRSVGPALMSGRIADLKIHPEHMSTWYVAVGSGGVWKTTNAGTTWDAIFEGENSYSIGCVTLDPNRPETVWVGSGENVSGRHVGYGDGVYRSYDGGENWENVGLKDSEHIGTILVDPRDSHTVYVAAQGPLWSSGGERGLYKTTDNGETWDNILSAGPYTGCNEVHMDPRNPDVLYAVLHQRLRNVAALINGGPESGVHKSTDAGATWTELTSGLPGSDAEEQDMGKIGLAVSPIDPDLVYVTVEQAHRKGGFYRSSDGGATWKKQNDYISGGTGPHYYQELFASPHALDRVYQMDVRMNVTEDGGKNFRQVNTKYKHVDNHALAFRPDAPEYLLSGTDGGIYESYDLGETWRFISNLPLTQFYKVSVDYAEPFYNIYGGTQDNNTQGGPSRTDNYHGIRNSDWEIILFGDGHQPFADPTDPNIVYAEWQRGNLCRIDRLSGEITYIQPQPAPGDPIERFNWDGPILISPHHPEAKRLYFASQRLWRSDDRGDTWTAVSGDLTRNQDRYHLPMMDDRVWSFDAVWDLYAMSDYNTITSISESPIEEGLIYIGTDDGIVQVTEDGGENWRKIDSLPGIDDEWFVNDIKADLHDPDVVYVVVDQHKRGDYEPYVYRSDNRGKSWKSIRADLPDRHVAWRIVQDHVRPELLFLGTEFGVFFTVDAGEQWIKLEGGVPNIPFRDLVIQTRENDLVGATFGRSFYVLDDYAPLREVTADALEKEAHLFAVREADWYIERPGLGWSDKASQGDGFYVAPNPPFGATFTYYLKDSILDSRKARRKAEKEVAEEGGDNPRPDWETIRDEELELEPKMLLTVRNADGDLVRVVEGPASKGMHRVSWNLRYASVSAWSKTATDENYNSVWARGRLAAPGEYTVSLAKRVDGVVTELGMEQAFQVTKLRERGLPGVSPEEFDAQMEAVYAASRDLSAAQNSINETIEQVKVAEQTLVRSTAPLALRDDLASLLKELQIMKEELVGNHRRNRVNDPGYPTIQARLAAVTRGNNFSTYGMTPQHEMSLAEARKGLDSVAKRLDDIHDRRLPELEARMDAGGVPWTPGRKALGAR